MLPQLLTDPAEISLFEACAVRTDAQFVERILLDGREQSVARFHRRREAEPADPSHAQVQALVAGQGGDAALCGWHAALAALPEQRPGSVVVPSQDGAPEDTYQRLLASLPGTRPRTRPTLDIHRA